MIKQGVKKLLVLSFFVIIPLIFGAVSIGYGGGFEDPSQGEDTITGRRIFAWITAISAPIEEINVPLVEQHVAQAITGKCRQKTFVESRHKRFPRRHWEWVPFLLGPSDRPITPDNINDITAKCADASDTNCIENFVIDGGGPPGCYSPEGGEDLIVTRVLYLKRFINPGNPPLDPGGTYLRAWVILRKLEPAPVEPEPE